MDQVWNALLASGPVAMVLGVAVLQLWRKNEQIRVEFATLLKAERDRHQEEEEKIRREYIDTLRSMTAHVKGDRDA